MNSIKLSEKLDLELFKEAQRIADVLISQAIKTKNGYTWKGVNVKTNDVGQYQFSLEDDPTIYSGSSGIAIFLNELFIITQDSKYLTILHDIGLDLINTQSYNSKLGFSFLTGQLGIAVVLMYLSKTCKNDSFATHAIKIATSCESYILAKETPCEYLNGLAGTTLALLLIFEDTQNEKILSLLDLAIGKLISRLNVTNAGIFFDENPNMQKPLCGFSHGVSGVGYVFLMLYKYFKNFAFVHIARMCFNYEDQYLNDGACEWPDFRKPDSLPEILKEYKGRNVPYFRDVSFMSAWCHGSAGIIPGRLLANELRIMDYNDLLEQRLISDPIPLNQPSYTLCHGICGNCETMLLGYKSLGENQILRIVRDSLSLMLKISQSNNGNYKSGYDKRIPSDNSLFMGIAGIGHFILRFLFTETVDSVLFPSIKTCYHSQAQEYSYVTYSQTSLFSMLFSKAFPKSFSFINSFQPNFINSFLETTDNDLRNPVKDYYKHIYEVSKKLNSTDKTTILSLLDTEQKILNLRNNYSRIDIFMQSVCMSEKLTPNPEFDTLKNMILIQNPLCYFAKPYELESTSIFYVPSNIGVCIYRVTDVVDIIYKKFKIAKTIDAVVNSILKENFETDNLIDVETIKQLIFSNIVLMIKRMILMDPDLLF